MRVNNFNMVDVKGKKLMMLKDPIQILNENLTATLGSPQDIQKIASNQASYELDKEVEIPRSKEVSQQPVVQKQEEPVKEVKQAVAVPVQKKVEEPIVHK